MKNKITQNPLVIGAATGIVILVCCLVFTIPMYDGVYHYEKGLFLVEHDGKVALTHLLGMDVETLKLNEILPEIRLKPIGYVLFVLIHVGLPILAGLRVHFANLKKKQATN
jgi:hypothetical protein